MQKRGHSRSGGADKDCGREEYKRSIGRSEAVRGPVFRKVGKTTPCGKKTIKAIRRNGDAHSCGPLCHLGKNTGPGKRRKSHREIILFEVWAPSQVNVGGNQKVAKGKNRWEEKAVGEGRSRKRTHGERCGWRTRDECRQERARGRN